MSNINKLILEDGLPKMHEVGAGYGKWLGSNIGSMFGPMGTIAGYTLGHHLGKDAADHPNAEMNPKQRSHRFGAMLNNEHKLKNLAITAIGAGIGAALGGGAHAHKLIGKKGSNNTQHLALGGGAAIGAAVAHHLFGAGRDNRRLAKKLGYGKLGRIGSSFTSLTGLFHPHTQKDD